MYSAIIQHNSMEKNAWYSAIKTACWLVFRGDTNHGVCKSNIYKNNTCKNTKYLQDFFGKELMATGMAIRLHPM